MRAKFLGLFAVVSLSSMLLVGCADNTATLEVNHEYSKTSIIFEFCESLRESIESSPQNVSAYAQPEIVGELRKESPLLDLETVISNLDVPIGYLDWEVVDTTERKSAYILTLPLHVEYYDMNGNVRNVSDTTVEEYIEQFEEKTKGITYARSKIDDSGYTFLRIIAQPNDAKPIQLSNQFSRNLITQGRDTPIYHAPIYVEFDGLPFDLHAAAEMIVVFKEHILFLDINRSKPVSENEAFATLRVRIFDQGLKPGERPFLYDHPTGQRKASGPLRHIGDNGCSFTLSNRKIHTKSEKS